MKAPPRTFTIGRDKKCDIPIADDSVSRLHAELTLSEDGKLSLTDSGSSNGTVLLRQGKSRRVQREILSPADRVRFGSVELGVQDLVDTICRKHPDVGARFRGLDSARLPSSHRKGKLVRCACGAIKPQSERCPACGE
jgi:pSer/pThr/pTyr-binding forkhead associated (FHA) protein